MSVKIAHHFAACLQAPIQPFYTDNGKNAIDRNTLKEFLEEHYEVHEPEAEQYKRL